MKDDELEAYYIGQEHATRNLKESVRLAKQHLGYMQDAVKDAQKKVQEAEKWVREAEEEMQKNKLSNPYHNRHDRSLRLAKAWEKGFSDERNSVPADKRPERIIGCNGNAIPQATVRKIRKAKLEGRWGPGCERTDSCIGSCDWCETRIIK